MNTNLEEYSNAIRRLKKEAEDAGLSEEDFKRIYLQSLQAYNMNTNTNDSVIQRMKIKYKVLLIMLLLGIAAYNFKSIYSCLICSLQEYIYPGLRLLRQASIPLISIFPALTDLYQETCLIHNPFFTVVDMDCWPCSTVSNARHIQNPQPVHNQHSAPFVYETNQQVITMPILKEIYEKHKIMINQEASKILTNNKYYTTPSDLFNKELFDDGNLYFWKFNNLNVIRILRQIIPRPIVVPKFGQSTERYIVIDSKHNSFRIPDTECHFSFLLSLSGNRKIKLEPAEECKHQCKSLNMELKETHLLWYNWWYWRPVVQQSSGNTTFIAHVGSYC